MLNFLKIFIKRPYEQTECDLKLSTVLPSSNP